MDKQRAPRHSARDGSGRFSRTQKLDPRFRPHQPVQVTQTAGTNPNAPAGRQSAPSIAETVPYVGDSPTGYDPYTMGTF